MKFYGRKRKSAWEWGASVWHNRYACFMGLFFGRYEVGIKWYRNPKGE